MVRNAKDPVRFAVVGLGWIAQEDVLPAFKRGENFELVALVSGDEKKRKELGEKYGIERVVGYEGYEELLSGSDVDAVYIALPNRMHKEYTIKAAKAGVHVLCEKPMAVTEADCREMIEAAEAAGVKLMIAYRLHFEEANMAAVEVIQSGEIGEPRFLTCGFSQTVVEGNIRLEGSEGYGPTMDMGVYPINAARYFFREEPMEVSAISASKVGDKRWAQVPEMTSVVMRFPGEKLASFTASFGCASSGSLLVVGTKGSLEMKPPFSYSEAIEMTVTVEGKERKKTFRRSQQFGAEMAYFAKVIQENMPVEPNGLEGLADIRVVRAVEESARQGGKAIAIEPVGKGLRPGKDQVIRLRPKMEDNLVNAAPPEGKDEK